MSIFKRRRWFRIALFTLMMLCFGGMAVSADTRVNDSTVNLSVIAPTGFEAQAQNISKVCDGVPRFSDGSLIGLCRAPLGNTTYDQAFQDFKSGWLSNGYTETGSDQTYEKKVTINGATGVQGDFFYYDNNNVIQAVVVFIAADGNDEVVVSYSTPLNNKNGPAESDTVLNSISTAN